MSAILDAAPMVGLLFFFSIFLWIAVRTYRPSQKQEMQSLATIPLREESDHE